MKTTFKKLTQLFAISAVILFQSCGEDEAVVNTPKVTTVNATEITFSSAKLGGDVTSTGGAGVIAKGIVFATTPEPTVVTSDTTNQGEGAEAFSVTLTELLPNTTYYARAYATNKAGTSYGLEYSFSTQTGAPVVSLAISNISYKEALATFSIDDIGASAITGNGFVYSEENAMPTIMDIMWPMNSTELTAENIMEDLTPGKRYYFRAYAQNFYGTTYSNVVEVTTKAVPSSITDIDGNVYGTTLIGDRVWLNADLKVTKYNNGDAIATTLNSVDGEGTPKYQWPANNDEANVPTYGRVYTYYAVMDSRKACPVGTHVSNQDDWDDLNNTINGAGWKLKTSGTNNWLAPNTSSNNEVGFNAVGSGYRSMFGGFMSFKENSFYITPEQAGEDNNFFGFYLAHSNGQVWVPTLSKKSGYSVRCVVD